MALPSRLFGGLSRFGKRRVEMNHANVCGVTSISWSLFHSATEMALHEIDQKLNTNGLCLGLRPLSSSLVGLPRGHTIGFQTSPDELDYLPHASHFIRQNRFTTYKLGRRIVHAYISRPNGSHSNSSTQPIQSSRLQ